MMVLSLILMFGGVLFYIFALNISIVSFRKLVDYQFQNFHDLWEKDGRPVGGKMTRSQLSFFGSDLSTTICGFEWAIKRPEWLEARSEADGFRRKMIHWFFISLIGFFSFAGGMLIFGTTLRSMG